MSDFKSIVIGVILMLRKYTIIDITIYEQTNENDYINGIYTLPLIGFVIGFISILISSLAFFYDSFFISVLILIYYNIVTKTNNMMELYRTLNYYIKPKNQTEQLAGIIGVILLNLMYFSLFRLVSEATLVVMFVSGYSNLIILSSIVIRNKENTSIIKYCDKSHVIAAFAFSFLVAIIFNYKLVISLSLTYMISGLIFNLLEQKIKKLPSSVEGAIIEITQIIFLIITYLMML